ncbi:hypothetical protein IWW48_004744 [Coemansia sp. RSA 1200]|nr:hypothetical protein IWW48_004744 [Coemansia sp. RSA 1200]
MALRPFRIPETRLLVINELVVQTTLTFRTDEDEELNYRYTENKDLQTLVQTAVVSLVNCGYTHGIAQGPGFILHQLRKKWPIGRRYIFTRHGEPLQSSLHKYFFQLEFVDDAAATATGGLPPVLEITELRGIGLSPSVSSMAGSTIEGLDAVALPPMAAIFGGASQQQQQQQQQYSGEMARSGGHRRSGSGHSNRSFQSSFSNRPQSPSPLSHRGFSPDTGRLPTYHRSVQGALLSSSPPQLHTQYANRSVMEESPRVSTDNGTGLRGRRQPGGSADNEILSSDINNNDSRGVADERSPAMSTLRTRSVSRSSIGSANRSMQQSIAEEPPANEDDDGAATGAALARTVEAAASDPAKPHWSGAPSGPSPPINSQLRIGHTSWYRSLHGISPLSRQQKSLSSSDNEFAFGGIAGADPLTAGAVSLQHANPKIAQHALAADPTGGGGSALDVSKIPRIAGQPVRRSPVVQEDSFSPPTRIGGNAGGGGDGLAARLKRKILSPINMHRERLQRNSSSLSREMQRAQAAESRAARGDSGAAAASPETGGASALNGGSYGERAHLSAAAVADPRGESVVDSRLSEDDNASMMSTDSAAHRPSMPPPSRIPPPRTQRLPQSNEQEQQKEQQRAKNGGSGAFRYRSAADIASIPEAVKNALLRRIRSPLGGRPDKSSARLSVRDRIAAFNTLTVNSRRNSKSQEHYKEHQQQQVTPPVSGSENSSSARMAAAAVSAKQIPPTSPAIAQDLATSSSFGRTRIGTATGFISMASPVSVSGVVRPHSRASSSVVSMNTRPVSPALSQRSNVSMRVQDAINSLERAANAAGGGSSVATTPRALNSPAVGSGLSGTKRSAAAVSASEALDRFSTPTKRPRAPSLVSYADADPDAGSSSVSPFGLVQRIIRRNTGR